MVSMRRHFKCKKCGHEFDDFGSYTVYYCPLCMNKSDDTSVESWAIISYFSFDQDIQNSLDDGTFLKAFEHGVD